MRKKVYEYLDKKDVSDFVSQKVYLSGYRSTMEPEAISIEKTTRSVKGEFRMRSRVVTRAISGIVYLRETLNPFKYTLNSFKLISHKIIRWLVPVFMMIVFLSNLTLLDNRFYYTIFQLQSLFYVLALFGFILDMVKLPKFKVFFIPYYFCVVNLAALYGICKYVMGKRDMAWTPER